MVTREQIEEALDSIHNIPYQAENIDYEAIVIALLRERIPYGECPNIISGAEFDVILLCEVYKAAPYLTEENLMILADCNCFINEETDCLAVYV